MEAVFFLIWGFPLSLILVLAGMFLFLGGVLGKRRDLGLLFLGSKVVRLGQHNNFNKQQFFDVLGFVVDPGWRLDPPTKNAEKGQSSYLMKGDIITYIQQNWGNYISF